MMCNLIPYMGDQPTQPTLPPKIIVAFRKSETLQDNQLVFLTASEKSGDILAKPKSLKMLEQRRLSLEALILIPAPQSQIGAMQ